MTLKDDPTRLMYPRISLIPPSAKTALKYHVLYLIPKAICPRVMSLKLECLRENIREECQEDNVRGNGRAILVRIACSWKGCRRHFPLRAVEVHEGDHATLYIFAEPGSHAGC